MTVVSLFSLTLVVTAVLSVVNSSSAVSCTSADEARNAAADTMKRAEHAGPEDKCDAYRQMSALFARYQTDWRRCAPFSGKDANTDIDVQARFYDTLVRKCG